MGKGGFQFAHAPLIPRLMVQLGRGVLRRHTPCGSAADVTVARSLAEVHAELILIHPFRDGNGRLARLVTAADGVSGRAGFVQIERLGGCGEADVCAGYPGRDEPRLRAARDAFRARD